MNGLMALLGSLNCQKFDAWRASGTTANKLLWLQGMMHKRARIMDEDHSGLPFACLPAHGLSYAELPGHGSMPFGRSPLPGAGHAGAQLPSAPQADPGASQRSEAPAGEPAGATAPYAEDTYQDADKEVNYCCTRP